MKTPNILDFNDCKVCLRNLKGRKDWFNISNILYKDSENVENIFHKEFFA